MKVTKRGKPASDRKWVGTCKSCNSEAEAKESEMTNITYDQRERGSFSWEKCPVCGKAGGSGMIFYPKGE